MNLWRFMGAAITTTQFYLHGRRQSTLTGYRRHVTQYREPYQTSAIRSEAEGDKVDLSGKAIIITGANSGIGYEVASYAASKGARVYMVSASGCDRVVRREHFIATPTYESACDAATGIKKAPCGYPPVTPSSSVSKTPATNYDSVSRRSALTFTPVLQERGERGGCTPQDR